MSGVQGKGMGWTVNLGVPGTARTVFKAISLEGVSQGPVETEKRTVEPWGTPSVRGQGEEEEHTQGHTRSRKVRKAPLGQQCRAWGP